MGSHQESGNICLESSDTQTFALSWTTSLHAWLRFISAHTHPVGELDIGINGTGGMSVSRYIGALVLLCSVYLSLKWVAYNRRERASTRRRAKQSYLCGGCHSQFVSHGPSLDGEDEAAFALQFGDKRKGATDYMTLTLSSLSIARVQSTFHLLFSGLYHIGVFNWRWCIFLWHFRLLFCTSRIVFFLFQLLIIYLNDYHLCHIPSHPTYAIYAWNLLYQFTDQNNSLMSSFRSNSIFTTFSSSTISSKHGLAYAICQIVWSSLQSLVTLSTIALKISYFTPLFFGQSNDEAILSICLPLIPNKNAPIANHSVNGWQQLQFVGEWGKKRDKGFGMGGCCNWAISVDV